MSLLDENLDIDCVDVLKSQILHYLKHADIFEYRERYRLGWFDEIIFEGCRWEQIIKEPYKYYLYFKIDWSILYIHIGKIHERLSGQKYGVDSPYAIVIVGDKYINIKQALEYEELIEK